jgi:hypothetical protein
MTHAERPDSGTFDASSERLRQWPIPVSPQPPSACESSLTIYRRATVPDITAARRPGRGPVAWAEPATVRDRRRNPGRVPG